MNRTDADSPQLDPLATIAAIVSVNRNETPEKLPTERTDETLPETNDRSETILRDNEATLIEATIVEGSVVDREPGELTEGATMPGGAAARKAQRQALEVASQTSGVGSRHFDSTARYRSTKLHARGGLGAVYQAQDVELNRIVALKEILPDHADNPRLKEKFVFEAEVTGSLEHPGIVPVYGFGRYQDGQPYYAMRFIRGNSFRSAIASFHEENEDPSSRTFDRREFRRLLRRLIDACNAIDYAHTHGVLHRDIKPANIMLGEFGETLVVDWGLAKLMDRHRIGAETSVRRRLKRSGNATRESERSAVGTPMYMSPEQAQGNNDHLDGRTDVYSLGAVLFNIVSGQHPVEGDSTREIISKVRNGKIRGLEDAESAAPKALGSICRKAMAHDPEDRYATAGQLADDIDRWLNDAEVLAHVGREGAAERLGRLIRRNRSWTLSTAAALLLITIVAIASTVVIHGAKEKERIAKEDARTSKREAVRRYRASRETIDTWLEKGSDALQFFPGTRSVRNRLLEIAIDDYEKLSKQYSRDPELELERARALVRLGDLHQMQRSSYEARSQYSAALSLLKTGLEDDRLGGDYLTEIGNVHSRLGIAWAKEDPVRAERHFGRSVATLTSLVSERDNGQPRLYLAEAYIHQGGFYSRHGKMDQAVDSLVRGVDQYMSTEAVDAEIELEVGQAQDHLGRIHMEAGKFEEASRFFADALDSLIPLVETSPGHPDYIDALAAAYVFQASSFRARGMVRQQLKSLDSAVRYYRLLRKAMPDDPRFGERLAITLSASGLALYESGANGTAELRLLDSQALLEKMVQNYGNVIRFRENLAICRDALGLVYLDVKRDPDKAAKSLSLAHAYVSDQMNVGKRSPEAIERFASISGHFGRAAYRQGEMDVAGKRFGEAIASLQKLKQRERLPRHVAAAADLHSQFGWMLHDKEASQAREHFVSARDAWLDLAQNETANATHELAWLLATCPDDSIRDPAAAIVYAKQATILAPENMDYRTTLALAKLLAGHPAQSLAELNEMEAEHGPIDRIQFVRAMSEHAGGNENAAMWAFKEATDWMDKNRPYNFESGVLRRMAESRLENVDAF